MSGNSTEGTKANAPTTEGGRGSLLPVALLGVILGIVALIVLWPSSENDGDNDDAARTADKRGEADGAASAKARGGVVAKDFDDPSRPAPKGKMNPLLEAPVRGMAPTKPEGSDEPPPGASREEQIAFYEKQLADAVRNRDNRKVFADRLPAAKARLDKSSLSPTEAEATYDRKAKIVEENLAKAEERVQSIEKKLAELRGG